MSGTCKTCRHSQEGKPPVCRRFPPQTHFLMTLQKPTVLDNRPPMPREEQRSAFPPINPDWTCGEWAPAIAVVS